MNHVLFSNTCDYANVILIKDTSFNQNSLRQAYVNYLCQNGVNIDSIFAVSLPFNSNGKIKAAEAKANLITILTALKTVGTKTIYCADATYFKQLTGLKPNTANNSVKVSIEGFTDISVIYGLNHSVLLYNPTQKDKMIETLNAYATLVKTGSYTHSGGSIIHSEEYPQTFQEIKSCLQRYLSEPKLTVDIEAFSLSFFDAGIGTISFAKNKHEGIAFLVDYQPTLHEKYFGSQTNNQLLKELLRNFFEAYKGKLVAHNAGYDFKVLIYNLWMKHPLDRVGMRRGIEVLTRCFDDTIIISYLAMNTTAEISRSLKSLGEEFAGNYAQEDIKDIRLIPVEQLLRYNLTDCLTNHYVLDKYYPIMVNDQQEEIYLTLFKPSITLILQMELVGMPMSDSTIVSVRKELMRIESKLLNKLHESHLIEITTHLIRADKAEKANAKLKKLRKQVEDFESESFNFSSSHHLQILLYEVMQLPVIEKTDTGQPATGKDVLQALINHTDNPDFIKVIDALIGLSKVSKIITTFIPAFEEGKIKSDGMRYLHGSFKLGGAVSGRMSSYAPNMQNLPSGSTYGKLIKSCFVAPKGWLMVYADYSSLEDRISGLVTKDPNKLRVYSDGFDGHSLRASYYFPEQYVGVGSDPASINAAVKTHAKWRQISKEPTFLLTYMGTYHGLMKNCGFSLEKAKAIEANYHTLYKVSTDYVNAELDKAAEQGYIEVAFGMRIRTAILHRVAMGTKVTPYMAHKERKTLGNAIGQSWCLLNNRSTIAFTEKVAKSEFREDIYCISMIHDAAYFLIRDDVNVIKYVNDNLIAEMYWQDHPKIQHDIVRLGGELDICLNGWDQTITISNNATLEEIQTQYEAAQIALSLKSLIHVPFG